LNSAVERIDQYLKVPQEPPAIIESNRPPAYWPSTTSPSSVDKFISVENLVVRYAPDLPDILHGVTFDIKAGERVGLVGRTGSGAFSSTISPPVTKSSTDMLSGKSTLVTALLRFVDPVKGRIIVDGIDITTIGLFDLRSRMVRIRSSDPFPQPIE
jgi:ABC-type multidrug transport system fused ATPase/permease subunit